MNITDLYVHGFGIWTDLSLERLAPHLTVIYGPNEAGKTTLIQFIRATLYGYSDQQRQRYLPPVHGGDTGGIVKVSTLGGQYHIVRAAPPADAADDYGGVTVLTADRQSRGNLPVRELLAHVDEAVFANVFAIGLAELQELALLQETEAADELYKLAAGVDRVSLVDVMRRFQQLRQQLWANDRKSGELVNLLAERERCSSDLERLAQQPKRWLELVRKSRQLEEAANHLETQLNQARRLEALIETAQQLCDTWQTYQIALHEVRQFAEVRLIAEELVQRVERLSRMIADRQQRLAALQQQHREVLGKLRRLRWQPHIWKARHKLQGLNEQVAWLGTLDKQIADLQPEISKLEAQLHQACQETGISHQAATAGETRVDHRTLAALRKPAKALRQLTAQLRTAQRQHQEAARRCEQLAAQWEAALASCGVERLDTAKDELSALIRKLQQRKELDEQIERTQRQKKDLDDECLELLKTPLMPLRHILAWGSIVALGVMLTLVALFSEWVGDLRVPLILFGLTCTGGGFLLKHAYQQINSQELDERQRSLARANRQLQQLLEERQAMDSALPSTVPVDQQLREAQQRLRRLDELLPLKDEQVAAQRAMEEVTNRVNELSAALRQARQRWQMALAKHHLSEQLSPAEVRRLATNHERLTAIRRQLAERRQELERKQTQKAEVAHSTAAALRELGLASSSDDPKEHLRELTEAVAAQERLRQERQTLKQELGKLHRRIRRCHANIQRLRLYRQALYSQVGARQEAEFQQLLNDSRRKRTLQEQLTELEQRIRLVLGTRFPLEEVEPYLAPGEDLAQRRQQVLHQIDQLQRQHGQLMSEHGALAAEMKGLIANGELDQARLRLASVDARLAEARRQWTRLTVTLALLEKVQRKYESERQPEALNEASRYLQMLTGGRYRRLWTPLGTRTLRVDDQEGRTLDLHVLSQGTREAIFLSLRFAIAAAYARRGAALPMILDDVLANFDAQRTENAVLAIHQFALDGHQVLFFTCHEHVAALFASAGADVRCLPGQATPRVVISPGASPLLRHAIARQSADATDHRLAAQKETDHLPQPTTGTPADTSSEHAPPSQEHDAEPAHSNPAGHLFAATTLSVAMGETDHGPSSGETAFQKHLRSAAAVDDWTMSQETSASQKTSASQENAASHEEPSKPSRVVREAERAPLVESPLNERKRKQEATEISRSTPKPTKSIRPRRGSRVRRVVSSAARNMPTPAVAVHAAWWETPTET